jgi:hypothetical protein
LQCYFRAVTERPHGAPHDVCYGGYRGAPLLYIGHEPPAPKGEAILVPKGSTITTIAEKQFEMVACPRFEPTTYSFRTIACPAARNFPYDMVAETTTGTLLA